MRLRLQVRPGAEERVAAEVEKEAHRLFDLRPSTRQIDPEHLARATALIASNDPAPGAGEETEIHPDNSLCRAPFEPEVERYGGSHYLPASLGLFALSSATALQCLGQMAGSAERSRLLVIAAETLLRQALGFACNSAELERLLAYGLKQWGKKYPRAAKQAAETWDRQHAALAALVLREVKRWAALVPSNTLGSSQDHLAMGSLILSHLLGRLEPAPRHYAGWSHLHMTANRLGLRNSEEVYLSALLGTALKKAREQHPEVLDLLDSDPKSQIAGYASLPIRSLSTGLGPVLLRILDGPERS